MSKKTNTLWFILGATAFNILTTLICFILLLVVFGRLNLPESAAGWGLAISFIGGIALSFVLYRFILKQIMKKIDMEKYFDPIFGRRRK